MIVLGDISDLYRIDLENRTIAAVLDYVNAWGSKHIKTVLKLKPTQYFNAGLLVIDTKKMKEKEIKKRAFALLK